MQVQKKYKCGKKKLKLWRIFIFLSDCRYTQANNYLVNIRGYCYTEDKFSIIMEYMSQGSLYDLIHKNKVRWNIIKKLR